MVEPLVRPPAFDEIVTHVRASDAPAVLLIDRENFRALLDYIAKLEERLVEQGDFW